MTGSRRREPWYRSRSPAAQLVTLSSLLIIVLLAATAGVATRRLRIELGDAARELHTLDVLLAEETGRSLQSIGLVLESVVGQIVDENTRTPATFAGRAQSEAIFALLRQRSVGVQQLSALTVVSAAGKLLNFSRYWPIPDIDLNDREYIRYLRAHPGQKLYLSEPVLNRGSGTPTIYLVRRVDAPDGSLLGFVLGAIELAYFDRFYRSLHFDSGNVISLWREDGALLAQYPPTGSGREAFSPAEAAAEPWYGVPGVGERTIALPGGGSRLWVVATQRVAGFPLQIDIGRRKTLILHDWRRDVAAIGSAIALAILAILIAMWTIVRRFEAYEALAAASQEREQAVAARRVAEDSLRQAQKMEAVGQLTGGVAHDFNNLLTVVRSAVDLLLRPSLSEDRRLRYVNMIADATDRATKLTGQLLAFARRQALKPVAFDVVANLEAVLELIGRLAGPNIRVETRLPERPCFIEADPNQFDTAIVNMAVNSRDAMEGSGLLTIAVVTVGAIPAGQEHDRREGAFVAVSIRDTGRGIAPDALGRVFEPFFTTKEVGHGTGLGLSQVFGFARQSGGDVLVESGLGEGTTFTLYLPRAADPAKAPRAAAPASELPPVAQGTRVLVVEDHPDVGQAAVQTLADLGYRALWAESGARALEELGDGPESPFSIVFTDVSMPGMSGIELGRIIRARFPDLPVLLTSGYSDVVARNGTEGFDLLQKPYSRDMLARALAQASVAGA